MGLLTGSIYLSYTRRKKWARSVRRIGSFDRTSKGLDHKHISLFFFCSDKERTGFMLYSKLSHPICLVSILFFIIIITVYEVHSRRLCFTVEITRSYTHKMYWCEKVFWIIKWVLMNWWELVVTVKSSLKKIKHDSKNMSALLYFHVHILNAWKRISRKRFDGNIQVSEISKNQGKRTHPKVLKQGLTVSRHEMGELTKKV